MNEPVPQPDERPTPGPIRDSGRAPCYSRGVSFSKITDILKALRDRYPALSNRMEEAEALSRWEKAVGPAIAKHAQAIQVKDGVLWVEVDHPVWKSELHHRKRQILERLNQKADGAAAAGAAAAGAQPGGSTAAKAGAGGRSGKISPKTGTPRAEQPPIVDLLLLEPRRPLR